MAIFYAYVDVEGRPAPWGRDTVWEGCRYHLRGVQSIGTADSGEAELVRSFFHFLARKIAESHRPCLVSGNGRGFDLPVLRYRAMPHHIPAAGLFRAGDRWNSYNSRYALDWHCNLQEATSDFGVAARCRMDEVAALVGARGKLGVDGSQVVRVPLRRLTRCKPSPRIRRAIRFRPTETPSSVSSACSHGTP